MTNKVEKLTPEPEVIVIEEIPESEAKDRILKLLDEIGDKTIYPDEISRELRIDFDMVMKILKDLKTEGIIEVVR
ncbi:MAG: hypothetical protein A7316_08790 [Candidatus Altiarchaeales archaeon WOR_SM1_86-2]|nr:MAG: hypothetical protein A7316_08790 [Candidatus Altiarchaeales archaeon WOR_SM1_86-2]